MTIKKKAAPHPAQPQKNKFQDHSTLLLDGAARQLIQFALESRKKKIPLEWLVGIMRRQGFTRARIDRAIDDFVMSGRGFFVIHETQRRESRLELWRAWK